VRRAKKDRAKPIPVSDLLQIAKFKAELTVYSKVRSEGHSHWAAMMAVWGDDEGQP
jgi:hypothetical protein